jgi:rod shape-determining protein MreD
LLPGRAAIRTILVFLLLLAIAVLQTTLLPALSVFGVTPDAMLVVVVCCGLLRGSLDGMMWGFWGGLAIGLLSGAPLGVHALVLMVIGYLAGIGERSPFRAELLVPTAAIAAATAFYMVGVAVLLRLSGWPLTLSVSLLHLMVLAILVNAMLMLVCYWLAARLVNTRSMSLSGLS